MKSPSHAKGPPQKRSWNFIEFLFFLLFVLWAGIGLYCTAQHVRPQDIAGLPISPAWIPFVQLCMDYGDPILILLAFINTHLHAARQWTPAIARNWTLLIVLFSFAIETIGTVTGFPFGEYHYTDRFGPMAGVVPFAIPFAWQIVITNSLFVVRAASPYASRMMEVVLTGLLCTLYDFILEPFATTVKHYWNWAGTSVPPLNYIAWFVLSSLLVWALAPTLSTRYKADPRPVLILGLTVMIFLAGKF